MTLARYTSTKFEIGDEWNPQFCDGYNLDALTIVEDPVDSKKVRIQYENNTGKHRGSWDSASGTYSEQLDIIQGDIMIKPAVQGGAISRARFLIALARERAHASPNSARIHVFVRLLNGGGGPDEGSFTGQGN